MGGGTPLLEANRVGCDVLGVDINPMAAWVVREEIDHLDVVALSTRRRRSRQGTHGRGRRRLPSQTVRSTAIPTLPVKYFLWVKTIDCENCGAGVDLFHGYLVAGNARPSEARGPVRRLRRTHGGGRPRPCRIVPAMRRAAHHCRTGSAASRCMCRRCGEANALSAARDRSATSSIVRDRVLQPVPQGAASRPVLQETRRERPRALPSRRRSMDCDPVPVRPGATDPSRRRDRSPASLGLSSVTRELFNPRQLLGLETTPPAASPRSRMNASGALSPPTSRICSDNQNTAVPLRHDGR